MNEPAPEAPIPRLYDDAIERHFAENRQMLLLSGPRQVGKTTAGLTATRGRRDSVYLNWDNTNHRRRVLEGPEGIARLAGLDRLRDEPVRLVFDEIHRFRDWKGFLKGLFDSYPGRAEVIVTGSARLDVFRAGGDSLMGRYFAYGMFPLTPAELVRPDLPDSAAPRAPRPLEPGALDRLLTYGGFPEPFLRGDRRFYNRWRRLRTQQLLREDVRDLTRVQELGQLEVLAELVRERTGQLVSYTSLANAVGVSIDTVKRWLTILGALYYCFPVRPWWRNVARALRKEPKYYLWDWSHVPDEGARRECLVAVALSKAVRLWTDHGFGDYGLHFIRDKQKREVDFLVTRDRTPWFLVEVKTSGRAGLSPSLDHFQAQTGAPHAFQLAFDLPPVRRDAFEETRPVIVPAESWLTQLV